MQDKASPLLGPPAPLLPEPVAQAPVEQVGAQVPAPGLGLGDWGGLQQIRGIRRNQGSSFTCPEVTLSSSVVTTLLPSAELSPVVTSTWDC